MAANDDLIARIADQQLGAATSLQGLFGPLSELGLADLTGARSAFDLFGQLNQDFGTTLAGELNRSVDTSPITLEALAGTPSFGAVKGAIETQFDNARQRAIDVGAPGGGLTSALGDIETDRARSTAEGLGKLGLNEQQNRLDVFNAESAQRQGILGLTGDQVGQQGTLAEGLSRLGLGEITLAEATQTGAGDILAPLGAAQAGIKNTQTIADANKKESLSGDLIDLTTVVGFGLDGDGGLFGEGGPFDLGDILKKDETPPNPNPDPDPSPGPGPNQPGPDNEDFPFPPFPVPDPSPKPPPPEPEELDREGRTAQEIADLLALSDEDFLTAERANRLGRGVTDENVSAEQREAEAREAAGPVNTRFKDLIRAGREVAVPPGISGDTNAPPDPDFTGNATTAAQVAGTVFATAGGAQATGAVTGLSSTGAGAIAAAAIVVASGIYGAAKFGQARTQAGNQFQNQAADILQSGNQVNLGGELGGGFLYQDAGRNFFIRDQDSTAILAKLQQGDVPEAVGAASVNAFELDSQGNVIAQGLFNDNPRNPGFAAGGFQAFPPGKTSFTDLDELAEIRRRANLQDNAP